MLRVTGRSAVRRACGAAYTDDPRRVASCEECLELVAEDLADGNDYRGRCLHCGGRSPPSAAWLGGGPCVGPAPTAAGPGGETSHNGPDTSRFMFSA